MTVNHDSRIANREPVKLLAGSRRRVIGVGLIEPIKKIRVAEGIADRIQLLILDGTFPPGRPLPGERQLAEQFSVSRGSVRDAFRTLETICSRTQH